MGEVVRVEIPPRLEYLALARTLVVAAAGMHGPWSGHRLADFEVAVSEACTNAVEAHRLVDQDGPIAIACVSHADRFEVSVIDRGPGLDAQVLRDLPAPSGPARQGREGGFGLPLIRRLADEVRFESSPSGTAVHLVLRRGDTRG